MVQGLAVVAQRGLDERLLVARLQVDGVHREDLLVQRLCLPSSAQLGSVLGSWGKTTRDAVRNKERWKGAVRLPKIL